MMLKSVNTKVKSYASQYGKAMIASMLMLSLAVMLTGCNDKGANEETATGADNDAKVLRIATEGAYPPFNYSDAEGKLGGFDIDIANALCAEMHVTCDIVAQDWEGIIPGLKANKYDAIVAAMSITPDRSEQVDFTEPYFINSLVFIANKDSDFDPSTEEVINGSKMAAQRSTISSQWFEKRYPNADMQMYDTLNNAFLDLESNRVDAMVSDKLPAIEWLSKGNSEFEIKGEEIDINDHLAIAVRKNDALKQELDDALAAIKANGEYDKIVEKHFGAL